MRWLGHRAATTLIEGFSTASQGRISKQSLQVGHAPKQPLRFFLQTGQIEWLLAPNRRFAAMLADKDYIHSYQELPSGHNWATWEQGLVPGLIYLFGSGV